MGWLGTPMIRCTINYGYDIHQIDMDEKTYLAIKNGQNVTLSGRGFVDCEEGRVDDCWHFNKRMLGEIYVSLDNGRELQSQEVWFDPAPQSLMPPTSKRGGAKRKTR